MSLSFNNLGAVRSSSREGRSLILNFGGPQVAISVLTDRLIRVRLAPEGDFMPRRSWAVARADEGFSELAFEIEESDRQLLLRTAMLTVKVDRDSGSLSFVDMKGRPFCADEVGMQWSRTESEQHSVVCVKRIEVDEHFYGFGERTGPLDKLGRQMVNWTTDPAHGHGPGTDPLYQAIPVFMALRPGLGYGVFFNNTWYSRFDIGGE
ncbi:MAG TPA: hypothetical protein VE843_02690, partial [Ktedonobacteraceae bacterium]|nr:hypothetical protein [Ktedonobacteraceae bacterium]